MPSAHMAEETLQPFPDVLLGLCRIALANVDDHRS